MEISRLSFIASKASNRHDISGLSAFMLFYLYHIASWCFCTFISKAIWRKNTQETPTNKNTLKILKDKYICPETFMLKCPKKFILHEVHKIPRFRQIKFPPDYMFPSISICHHRTLLMQWSLHKYKWLYSVEGKGRGSSFQEETSHTSYTYTFRLS